MKESKPIIYTLEDVADILRVCNKTIYTRIKNKEIKAFKEGNAWRIRKEDLDKYLENKRPII